MLHCTVVYQVSMIRTWITSQMLDLQSKVNFLLFNKLCCLASIKQNFYLVVVGSECRSSFNHKQQEQYTYIYLGSVYFISLAGGAWNTETSMLHNNIIHFLPATQKFIISVMPSKYLGLLTNLSKSVHTANISRIKQNRVN